MSCTARRVNDEMFCNRCGLVWSLNEQKPDCLTTEQIRHLKATREINKLRNLMSQPSVKLKHKKTATV